MDAIARPPLPPLAGMSGSPRRRSCFVLVGAERAGAGHIIARLRVSAPPFPGRHEGSHPYAALGGLRLVLRRSVIAAIAVRQRPTLPHHPGVDVGTVGNEADREDPMVAVETARLAPQLAGADMASAVPGRPPFRTAMSVPGRRRMFDRTRGRRFPASEYVPRISRCCRRRAPAPGRSVVMAAAWTSRIGKRRSRSIRPETPKRRAAPFGCGRFGIVSRPIGLPLKPSITPSVHSPGSRRIDRSIVRERVGYARDLASCGATRTTASQRNDAAAMSRKPVTIFCPILG